MHTTFKAKALVTIVLIFAALPNRSAASLIAIDSKVGGNDWTKTASATAIEGQDIRLRVNKVEDGKIKWYQIIPDTTTRYNNAEWPWMPNAYKWKGFDRIKYTRKELTTLAGKWEISITPSGEDADGNIRGKSGPISYVARKLFTSSDYSRSQFYNPEYGSFWYQAVVKKGSKTLQTPGLDNNDNRGLSPEVFRVSIKTGNGLVGNLTSFFNVPAVFGSTPYQVRNYIGVDCADVLMAAYALTKGQPIEKDYNVASLTRTLPVIKKAHLDNGKPDKDIYWGREIRQGDFIAVRYNGGRQYQHIGALYNDANANKILDPEDIILHAGPDPLHYSRLDSGLRRRNRDSGDRRQLKEQFDPQGRER